MNPLRMVAGDMTDQDLMTMVLNGTAAEAELARRLTAKALPGKEEWR